MDWARGIGFVLYLSLFHCFTGKPNVGRGSNNYGDINALLALLKCIVDKNISDLQVFGDSELTVN